LRSVFEHHPDAVDAKVRGLTDSQRRQAIQDAAPEWLGSSVGEESKGRVVLTGDAAWCATPIAGAGATLAVTGGYVLASELQSANNIVQPFSNYEEAMRPMVKKLQGVPKIAPRVMNPHTRLGIKLLHNVLNIASRPAIRSLAVKLFASEPVGPDLSRYDAFSAKIEIVDRRPVS